MSTSDSRGALKGPVVTVIGLASIGYGTFLLNALLGGDYARLGEARAHLIEAQSYFWWWNLLKSFIFIAFGALFLRAGAWPSSNGKSDPDPPAHS